MSEFWCPERVEQAPEQMPKGAPELAPDQAPEGAPEQALEQALEQAPEVVEMMTASEQGGRPRANRAEDWNRRPPD